MLNDIKQEAVINFMASIDKNLPKWMHLQNVFIDSVMYGWNSATRGKLIQEINEAYNK